MSGIYGSVMRGWSAYQDSGDRLFKKAEPSSLLMASAKNAPNSKHDPLKKKYSEQGPYSNREDTLDVDDDEDILSRFIDVDNNLTSPGGDPIFFSVEHDDTDLSSLTDDEITYNNDEIAGDDIAYDDFDMDSNAIYNRKLKSTHNDIIDDVEIDRLLAQSSDDEVVGQKPSKELKQKNEGVRVLPPHIEAKQSFDSLFG